MKKAEKKGDWKIIFQSWRWHFIIKASFYDVVAFSTSLFSNFQLFYPIGRKKAIFYGSQET